MHFCVQVEGAAAEVSARAAAAAQRTAARQWAASADDAPLTGIPADEACSPAMFLSLYISIGVCDQHAVSNVDVMP